MTFCDFQTTTFGKWILAGEHAVVRGHEALVFPIKEKQLVLSYIGSSQSPSAQYSGSHGADMQLLFWGVLEHGLQLLGLPMAQISGQFELRNDIPVGVGMGASAALCVAMSRWFHAQHMIDELQISPFAKELEHLFHGKSSGLDIAGVSSHEGVYFKAGLSIPLKPVIAPNWYLSSCNQIGITAHCIQQVQSIWSKNPQLAQDIDSQMIQSVQRCKQALECGGTTAMTDIANAINEASDCFFKWGLVSERLQQHMSRLLEQGALAVKPTGSGGGGYVLSLWDRCPDMMGLEFIAV